MKLLVYADPHWCAYSSIVRSRGPKYSTRLENLLNSLNWVESTAQQYGCEQIICLGDFFDRAELNSEEITALQDVVWADVPHIYLVGNHEIGRGNLSFSSSHLFSLCPQATVINEAYSQNVDGTVLCYLPYSLEIDRKPLVDYFGHQEATRIIFSHNDIKGIQMGKFVSTEGIPIDEIEVCCDLFINGHLPNTSQFGKNLINVGNLTGQNFSEDASQYRHYALLIDTDTHKLEWLENPYAFNFYKLDFTTSTSNDWMQQVIDGLGNNAVATIKVTQENEIFVRNLVASSSHLVEYRIIVDMLPQADSQYQVQETQGIDHLTQFVDYVRKNIGTSKEILEELDKVVEG